MPIQTISKTENEYGAGEVRSWASILDDNAMHQAERISRHPIAQGHVVLLPDAHYGYGPPVGTAIKTKGGIIVYAIGSDIGCGMIAVRTNLSRGDFVGIEGKLLYRIRETIPFGVGEWHKDPIPSAYDFVSSNGYPKGLDNAKVLYYILKKRNLSQSEKQESLYKTILQQYATGGSGNHYLEICQERGEEIIWFVLHSGSRGIGLQLAEAHFNLSKEFCDANNLVVEHPELSYFPDDADGFQEYLSDMQWCQRFAFAQRESMMDLLCDIVQKEISHLEIIDRINCHHNYAEEIEPGVWLTRKGAINAEEGRMGIIPGSMGAATYIVRGLGNNEAYCSSPHGAGRIYGRNQAKKTLSIEEFKKQMEGKFWQDRDAHKLLDEAPAAYKPIEAVINDSVDLVQPIAVLSQFINYKGF